MTSNELKEKAKKCRAAAKKTVDSYMRRTWLHYAAQLESKALKAERVENDRRN